MRQKIAAQLIEQSAGVVTKVSVGDAVLDDAERERIAGTGFTARPRPGQPAKQTYS